MSLSATKPEYKKAQMMQLKRFMPFRRDEDGAVAVDWVVLTAAVVSLALAALHQVGVGADQATSDISEAMLEVSPGSD